MIYYKKDMPEINAFYLRKLYEESRIKNTPMKEEKVILSPKTLKRRENRLKEHKMNRIKSMDNFMKYSWTWTL